MKQFHQCVEEVGDIDSRVGLHLDMSARWNSTYMMLESAIKYRRAFICLSFNDVNYKHCPSNEEWARGEKMYEFLEPFYEITNMISETTYLTSNLYFMHICMIEFELKKNKLNEDHVIRIMASKMMDEFDTYLSEHSMILAFGCVLDPRLKFIFLEYAYSKFDSNTKIVDEKLTNVRKALYALFYEYANKCASTSSSFPMTDSCFSTPTYKGKGKMKWPTEFYEFVKEERQKAFFARKSQLDFYLEEPRLIDQDDLDVLDYWKDHSRRFGDLARMARDILSIPIITVASESSFSIGGCILNKYRSCMLSENLQALICSRNWLLGFSPSDRFGDGIEETSKVDIQLSKQDSNVIVSDEKENED